MSVRTERLIGRGFTWLCGGALAVNLVLIVGLMVLLAWHGFAAFWPRQLVEVELQSGEKLLGEIRGRELASAGGEEATDDYRIQMRLGNRDLTGSDFRWIDEAEIIGSSQPSQAILLERFEWGNFYGYLEGLRSEGQVLARGHERVWSQLQPLLESKRQLRKEIEDLEKGPIARVNHRLEKMRLEERGLQLEYPDTGPPAEAIADLEARRMEAQAEFEQLAERLFSLREDALREEVVMRTADGVEKPIAVGNIVRLVVPNELGLGSRLGLYFSRIGEFLFDDPRESNTEGGIFPAIFGTVMMVFVMSIAVVPLGVLAALYLREYARQGFLVRAVRIAVNNLAGVPSIVFGIFGLGFFVYLIGGSIDKLLYPEALPTPTYGTGGILWASLTLALLTVPVVIVATEEGLAAVPRELREGSLALGATKFETILRVVLPASAPGILTGVILAMARAAGEVAPLMIVGMVKLAPSLPIDSTFPFVHLERKFMHLGFHIYDLGFQSPNVEATKPLVFATALLLILVVTGMNLVAIAIRNRLRRRYASSAV